MSDEGIPGVEVWLYGQFRQLAPRSGATEDSRVEVPVQAGDTLEDVVRRVGIDPAQVQHLFLNHQYSTLKRQVKPGDRLAVFGADMALLYRQYFPRIEEEGPMIQVQVRLYATLRRYQPQVRLGEAVIVTLPEGTSVEQLIAKLDLPADTVKRVFVQGEIVENDRVLSDGDEVGIFPPIAGG
jgi:molybdopterin converting factor small subunit